MSVEAVSWALNVPVGGNMKVVLLGLANHAHPDGTEAYPSLETLARYAHCDKSTARRNVRKLTDEGWISEDGIGPRGQAKYRLNLGLQNATGGKTQRVAKNAGGVANRPQNGAEMPPEPSLEPSIEPSTSKRRARATRTRPDDLPSDLPSQLRQTALTVAEVLDRTAMARDQKRPVFLEAVGRAVADFPTKDHLALAGRLEHWLRWGNGQRSPCRDIVERFRKWLEGEPDVRRPDGSPVLNGGLGVSNGVQGHRMSNADRVEANIQALDAASRRM